LHKCILRELLESDCDRDAFSTKGFCNGAAAPEDDGRRMWRPLCPLAFFFPFVRNRASLTDELRKRSAPLALQRRYFASGGASVSFQRKLRRLLVAAAIVGPVALTPEMSSAQGLLDFFFGGGQKQQQQTSLFGNDNNPQSPPLRPVVVSAGPAFCVRSCDGKYFPLMRGAASPAQICQAFCPASPTKVFFGTSIDRAYAATGERYADSENAFAYRKALRADCTCNGHHPAGLAPVDLALDSSLRRGDAVATTDGLVAYSGIRLGNDQTPDFTQVVAPARADMTANSAPHSEASRTPLPATRGRP
jgi:Protein of unknown function (DUF2865)